ncbi:Trm112 family protein [Phenylobacterium sp.]|uniref:Trm112 family protein n=1 Tax=Phenylobacterium sp. TaxID=1871053 RepID=UPI0025EEF6FA|nr:Trm112 family protein [Phenylobacterium sp.]
MTDPAPASALQSDVDPRLLEILVCPLTRGVLTYDRARAELVSKSARLAYPIRDGVPIMLPEEARELGEGE